MDLIDRSDLESLTKNEGHSFVSSEMKDFAKDLNIKTINDMIYFDMAYYTYFRPAKTEEEVNLCFDQTFKLDANEIFKRKMYRGCSDRGISIAPILRYLGIPTVYLEAARIDWIEAVQKSIKEKKDMSGHIFLEIYLNDKWYLYDPTKHIIYDDYDPENICLPENYVAFAKGMNQKVLGVFDIDSEQELAYKLLKDFDITTYKNPNYKKIDINSFELRLKNKKIGS